MIIYNSFVSQSGWGQNFLTVKWKVVSKPKMGLRQTVPTDDRQYHKTATLVLLPSNYCYGGLAKYGKNGKFKALLT